MNDGCPYLTVRPESDHGSLSAFFFVRRQLETTQHLSTDTGKSVEMLRVSRLSTTEPPRMQQRWMNATIRLIDRIPVAPTRQRHHTMSLAHMVAQPARATPGEIGDARVRPNPQPPSVEPCSCQPLRVRRPIRQSRWEAIACRQSSQPAVSHVAMCTPGTGVAARGAPSDERDNARHGSSSRSLLLCPPELLHDRFPVS